MEGCGEAFVEVGLEAFDWAEDSEVGSIGERTLGGGGGAEMARIVPLSKGRLAGAFRKVCWGSTSEQSQW